LLEIETQRLNDTKNEAGEIYKLIQRKELQYGNFLTPTYSKVQHNGELFSLRAKLMRMIEEHKRKRKGDIQWRGVPYIDILKLEKWAADNAYKEEIREEVEAKRSRHRVY